MTRKTLMSLLDNAVETLDANQAFLLDLESTVSKFNPCLPGSPHYKPSGMKCPRHMYFEIQQAPVDERPAEYQGVRICETGTDSHERIQGYVSKMQEAGYDCEWLDVEQYIKDNNLTYLEVRSKKAFETKLFDTRYNISFMCDGLIRYRGKVYILEIKTETEMKGLDRASAAPEHKNQSVSYCLSLGLNDVMWIYEERNFCAPKTFITSVTEEDKVNLIKQIEYVDSCVKRFCPPPKCNDAKICRYCNHKKICSTTNG